MLLTATRAALLDGRVYDEIRDRDEAMFGALGIVFIAAAAFGLGVWSQTRAADSVGLRFDDWQTPAVAVSTVFTGWFLWAIIAWLVGRVLLGGDAGYRQTVRAIGVCYAPVALTLFMGAIPAFALILAGLWPLIAAVVAVKRTHRFAWWKAAIATPLGWLWGVIVIPYFLLYAPLTQTPA